MSSRDDAIAFAKNLLDGAAALHEGADNIELLAREFLMAVQREEFPLMVIDPNGNVEHMAARFDGGQPEIQMADGRTVMRGWPFSPPLNGLRESGPA